VCVALPPCGLQGQLVGAAPVVPEAVAFEEVAQGQGKLPGHLCLSGLAAGLLHGDDQAGALRGQPTVRVQVEPGTGPGGGLPARDVVGAVEQGRGPGRQP